MPTEAKRQAIAELAELLRSSTAIAVADYRGLKVADMQAVRRTLREGGVRLTVAKNRLLKRAADLVFGSLLLAGAAVPMLLIAVLVKLTTTSCPGSIGWNVALKPTVLPVLSTE